jgi:hypothetical protein
MIEEKDSRMFLNEDDGGGGGEADTGSRGAAVFEGGQEAPAAAPEGRQEAPGGRSEPQAPVVDARALASEFGQVIGQHFRPPQKEMTSEEAKRLLNVWEPTPDWLTKYDNLETRSSALAELRDGFIRQADTITQYRLNEMAERMQQTYGQAVHYMQTQEARAGEWRFKQAFPDLGHEELRPLLYAVSQNLVQQGIPFRNERELFHAIATGVEAVIKITNPEFKLGRAAGDGAGGVPRQMTNNGRTPGGGIPVTTPGSGGGGGPKGTAPPKPRGLAIFD